MNTQTHSDDHPHPHDHGHEHPHGLRERFANMFRPHSHDHSDLAADRAFADNEAGIRTVWLALAALGLTSVLQLAIVFASSSVALLADTTHNIADALNSIPLLLAFYLARRLATRRYTYGYGRAEDVAGLFIVLSILISAAIVFWESWQRLRSPQSPEYLGWVAAAAIIGFLGNEAVAFMQIRVGNRIGSAALVADGLHARIDGLTSLAVLLAAGSAWLGYPLLDPLIGLFIGMAILFITWDAARRIWTRLMDGVDPEWVARVETAVNEQTAVQKIDRLRLHWLGHQLQGDLRLTLQPASDRATALQNIRHTLAHTVPQLTDLTIEVVEIE